MAVYNFSQLCTIYKCTINGNNVRTRFVEDVCFGKSLMKLNKHINDAKYEIILIRNDTYALQNKLNYCWMSKHQLETYLRRIKTIKSFKYKVYETEFKRYPCYKIDLQVFGTKKEITFVLQCIKRTYEWPLNFYLQQAYELQKLPKYKFDSILNLFNVVWSTYRADCNNGHSFSGNARFEKYKDIKEKLPHIQFVTDLYPDYSKDTIRSRELKNISYEWGIPNNTKQWDNKFFKKMLPNYIINYNALKR